MISPPIAPPLPKPAPPVPTPYERMRGAAKANPGAHCDWPAPDGSTVRCTYKLDRDRWGRREKPVNEEIPYIYTHLPSGLVLSAAHAERLLSGALFADLEAELWQQAVDVFAQAGRQNQGKPESVRGKSGRFTR